MLKCDKSKVFVPTRGKVFRSELTLEDQLAEAGWLLSLLALTQDQLDLLAENIDFLFLTGPPGTGEAGYIQSFQCTGCPEKKLTDKVVNITGKLNSRESFRVERKKLAKLVCRI